MGRTAHGDQSVVRHSGQVTKRSGPRSVALAAALVVVMALVATVWLGQRSQIYHPDTTTPGPVAPALPGARDVAVITSDGLTLGAWYLPPNGTCSAAVLVAPGNGGNRAGRVDLARAIADRGFGVLLLDYRGYGGNPGRPSETGLAADARAARVFLLEDAGVVPDELIYLGESIGTGVASELASQYPPAALVLRSPMTSFGDVVDALLGVPVGWVVRDRYPVREDLAEVDVPTAVVYGTVDTLVPPEQSREVAQVARDAGAEVVEVEVPGADHNDAALAHGEALTEATVAVASLAGVTGCG